MIVTSKRALGFKLGATVYTIHPMQYQDIPEAMSGLASFQHAVENGEITILPSADTPVEIATPKPEVKQRRSKDVEKE